MTATNPLLDWEKANKRDKISKQGSEPANSKPMLSMVLNKKDRAALDLERRLRAADLANHTVPGPVRPYVPKIEVDKKTGLYRFKSLAA